MLVLLISLVTVSAISAVVVMLSYVNLRPSNEAHTPQPTLSESSTMPDYSYLDSLDRIRGGGSSKPKKKPSGGIVSQLQRGGAAAKPASRLTAPKPNTAPARRVAAASAPATMQRDAGVSRTSTRPTRPIAAAPPAAPRRAPSLGSGGGGGGGGGGSWNYGSVAASPTGQYGGAPIQPVAPPPQLSDEEYLPTDSIYVSEAAGINADVQSLLDSLKRDRASYDVDFGGALRNLGWDLGDKGLEDPSQGAWDQMDQTAAYGSAYNNQQNDFAGRGMLTSSFYGKALEDLLSSFDRQRGDLIGARQGQFDDWTAQEGEAKNQQRQGLDRAKASALARRAAGLSLGGI